MSKLLLTSLPVTLISKPKLALGLFDKIRRRGLEKGDFEIYIVVGFVLSIDLLHGILVFVEDMLAIATVEGADGDFVVMHDLVCGVGPGTI